MSPRPGSYIIRPKLSEDDALILGPIPRIFPPPDVPVRIGTRPLERWRLVPEEGNTFTVWLGSTNPNSYKWIVNNNDLFASSTRPPHNFRFESAGNNLWVIGIPNEDLLLTTDKNASPALTFRPANGSPAQRFELIPIERGD